MEHAIRSDSSGLRENLAIIFRNKKKIRAVFFSTVLISFVGSFLVSKVYEANARILIQHHREASVVSTNSIPANTYTTYNAQNKLLSEIEIFKSTSVIEKVVEGFGPEIVLEEMSWRWDWLREFPSNIRTVISDGLWSFTPTTMLFKWLGLKPEQKNKTRLAITKITKHLWVEPVKGTNVFSIVFEAPNAEFSALMLNSLIDSYQDYHLYLRQGITGDQLFSEEVDRLRNELRTAKKELLKLKHSSGIISIKPQIQLLLEKLSKTRRSMEQGLLESTKTELRIKEIQRQLKKQPKVIRLENNLTRNPVLDTLTNRLAKLEIKKDLYVHDSASAIRLDDEISTIKQRISKLQRSVQGSERTGLNLIHQELQKDLGIEKKKLQSLKHFFVELNKYKQEDEKLLQLFDNEKVLIHEMDLDIEVKEQALRLFSKKQEEIRINTMLNNKKISDVAPIELAIVPDTAASPSKIKNLIIGIIVGLSAGLLVAYISEYFRRSLSTKEEVEDILGYPCLAAFRLVDDENKAEAEVNNRFQLKHLDQAVRQLNLQKKVQSIFIGSTVAGEGKSKVANMLAHSLTEKKSRVLLVGNLLVDQTSSSNGSNSNIKQMTQKFQLLEDPDNSYLSQIMMASSSNTGNENLSLQDLAQYIESIKNDYEMVIVDGQALSNVPEGITFASQMDGTIYVVEADSTSSIMISKTLDFLKKADAYVFGVVLNKRSFTIPDWVYSWFLLPVKH